MIKNAGGIAVLAHPILYKLSDIDLKYMLKILKEQGLEGIECIYSTYTLSDEVYIRSLAKKFQLKITGGSDFHGENKINIDLGTGRGKLFIPYKILEDLKK